MSDMPIYFHFIFAVVATVGFSIFFNSPVKSLVPAGIAGGIAWSVYIYLFRLTNNSVFSNFIAAVLVSFFSEILARKMKQPAIVFVIPGILPLVPGLGLYNTMLHVVQKNFDLALSTGADTILISGAISLGVLVVTSLSKTLKIVQIRKTSPNFYNKMPKF